MHNLLVISEHFSIQDPLAYQTACTLSKQSKAKISLLTTVYDSAYEQVGLLSDKERDKYKQALLDDAKKDAQALTSDNKSVTHITRWNKDLELAVDDVCHLDHYDLIIKTGHRSETLFHTPSDFKLLELPKVPVMILRRSSWRSKPVILATIDLSHQDEEQHLLNHKVLSHARQMADLKGAELHLCYVVTYSQALVDLDILDKHKLYNKFEQEQLQDLYQLASDYHIDRDHIHIKMGVVEKAIPSIANEIKADLVVLGTHRRKGLSRVMIGNHCEKILSIMRTDILAIKPD